MATFAGQILPDDKIFEIIVGLILSNSGYSLVSQGRLEGRGGWHQTDAFGDYPVDIPFVHRIKLLAEAKYYTNPVGINTGRDVLARTIDIDQQYRAQDYISRAEAETNRKTVKGAIFSVSGFAQTTLKFCYSHGIWCVDVPVWMGASNLRGLVTEIGRLLGDAIPSRRLTKEEKAFVDVISSNGYWSLDGETWEKLRKLIVTFVMGDSSMRDYRDDIRALRIGTLSTSTPIIIRVPPSSLRWLSETGTDTLEGVATPTPNDGNKSLVDIHVNNKNKSSEELLLYVPSDVYETYGSQAPITAVFWYRPSEGQKYKKVDIVATRINHA